MHRNLIGEKRTWRTDFGRTISRTDVLERGRTLRECKHMVAIARVNVGCKYQLSLCFKSPGTSIQSDYCSPTLPGEIKRIMPQCENIMGKKICAQLNLAPL